jgi:hypothetical protein
MRSVRTIPIHRHVWKVQPIIIVATVGIFEKDV